MKSWDDITPCARDAALAQLTGWVHVNNEYWVPPPTATWDDIEDWRSRWPDAPLPYSTSLDAMRVVEDVISGWPGVWERYIRELVDVLNICGDKPYFDWDHGWTYAVGYILRATPVQRAQAACVVLSIRENTHV